VVTGVTAKEAKDWAAEHLWGNCSSLYTPFCGLDGDEIDYPALRALVRHCLVELDQDGIWLTGGIAEFWSLTTDELKEVVRVAIEEARRVKPGALVQVMSSTDTAKQAVELTLNAQELGADICYILTPYFECSGKPGVLEYLRYVADRTDMPLGFFNSHSTGLILTPEECVELYREIPALCGLKNGLLDAQHSWLRRWCCGKPPTRPVSGWGYLTQERSVRRSTSTRSRAHCCSVTGEICWCKAISSVPIPSPPRPA
jgi:4-hydroxy-tetrahydrodipicolinate synthase